LICAYKNTYTSILGLITPIAAMCRILIDQTGRVYKAVSEKQDELEFTRIDSTVYWGYNVGSFDFSFNDTLFSFGGYGIWRENGQLRFFSDVFKEWNIMTVNKEYPYVKYVDLFDQKYSEIYFIQKPYYDGATGNLNESWKLIKLNLLKRSNTELVSLSKEIINILNNNSVLNKINLPALDGTLVLFSYEDILLLKFETNEVFKLTTRNLKDLILGNSNITHINISFESGDSVYYTLSSDSTDHIYSFHISLNDFKKENYSLYTPIEANHIKYYISIALILILFICTAVYHNIKKKINRNAHDGSRIELKNEDLDGLYFSEIEKNLISQMLVKSKTGNSISVDEINFMLGLSKKSLEIQKKFRSEIINRINHKFKVKVNRDQELIERIRSEEDRRFFKYSMNEENVRLYNSQNSK
jgi:hypothetical protein